MPALNRNMANRRALLRSLTTSLIKHGRIETTVPKAKELQRFAERMVTLGKKGNESAKKRAMMWLYEPKETIPKLFDDIAKRFTDRNGGYTRVYKIGFRKNDRAPMAVIEYLNPEAPESEIGFNMAIRNNAGSQILDIKKPQFPLNAFLKPTHSTLPEKLTDESLKDSVIDSAISHNFNSSPTKTKHTHDPISTNSSRILEKVLKNNSFSQSDIASKISSETDLIKSFVKINRDREMERFLRKNKI
ncbi:50S ribosomal protein L17 [Smittium culicis]|uniref:50S ribosomal protein L17 n=1 Tax=Smittium culicis TaxID=133412 RepID=A0A1R1XJV8_9FUNG|nr:50S ribosomal protein L17 [Smittium culicis]